MMNREKIKLIPFARLERKWMKDPEYKRVYDDLEFEFKIIKALIHARAKRQLTQRQLAQKIGVAQSALARFESGRTNPTLSFLKKVTVGLGLKLRVE